jgi:hypothetical protein
MYGLKPVPFTELGFWRIPPQAQKHERDPGSSPMGPHSVCNTQSVRSIA